MSEQSPHEAAWNAAHRQAWIAAASQALITHAPLVALLREIRGTREGDPRAPARLATRFIRRFKLFPSVRRAVESAPIRTDRRPPGNPFARQD